MTLRNNGLSGTGGYGHVAKYFAIASFTAGNTGTMRSFFPLPMMCKISGPFFTSWTVKDKASDIRNQHPNKSVTKAQSLVATHGFFSSIAVNADFISATSVLSIAFDNFRGTFGDDIKLIASF